MADRQRKILDLASKDIKQRYFENAAEWVMDNCNTTDSVPQLFGSGTPLQTELENYIATYKKGE